MRKLTITMLGVVALLLGSCSHEGVIGDEGGGNGNLMKVSVQIPALGGGIATRAGGVAFEEGENTLKSLHLLFFAPTTDGSGEYIDWVDVPMPDNANPEDNVMAMNIDTEVSMEGSLNAANAYNILAIANVSDEYYVNGSVDEWMASWEGKSESQVMATALATLPTAISPNSLLMHGRMEKPAGESQIHLLLERDVARFDVVNEAREEFDLVTVSIWNGYGTTTIWGDGIMDYSSAGKRTRFHYTANNEGNIRDGKTDILDDIKGGLYAFENRVSSPEVNDNVTTCLIVGLRNRATERIGYYRVNMTNTTGAQVLSRNDVYRLTVTGVTGDGAPDEETAYLGRSNQLIYHIGDWNVDDNGLTVRDDYSILSITTKRVTIDKDAKEVEISIHTFSTLPAPAPLTVRSQTYRPVSDDIQATLDGSTLVISASALGLDEQERHGVIVLAYAGLEISLNVVQSGVHDDFLHVTLPDGGIPRFPAYAGISSGLINVQASGPWTAKVYVGGFSFNPSTALAPVTEITSANNLVIQDEDDASVKKFRIYTHSFNTEIAPREEIIFITLDKDPETYKSIVLVSQDFVKKLYVRLPGDAPDTERETAVATFNGAGGLAEGIADNTDKFFVISGKNADLEILPWGAAIVMNGLRDDSQYFEVVETKTSISDPDLNYVTVRAKGLNTTGHELKATLRVQTDPGTFADVTLIQQPLPFELSPAITNVVVPAGGGESELIEVVTEETMNWKATIEMASGRSSDGRSMVNHGKATLVDEEGNALVEGQEYPVDIKFRVRFPKTYFPNRGIGTQAQVTVSVGAQTKTIAVNQAPLVARQVSIYTSNDVGYGNIITPSYAAAHRAYALRLGGSINESVGPFTGANYLHRTNYGMNVATTGWTNTNDFINNNDGVFILNADYGGSTAGMNNGGLVPGTWRFVQAGDPPTAETGWTNATDRKIYEFVVNRTQRTVDLQDWVADAESTKATQIPGSATSIIQSRGTGGYNPGVGGMVVIDPKYRIVYGGETQMWSEDNCRIWQRSWYYIAYTARYGSAFSDMFIDPDWEGEGTVDPQAVPAPWDDHWGANKIEQFTTTFPEVIGIQPQ